MTQTLILNNAGVKTYKAGEVFTLPGVFAYDNRKQAAVTPARLQQFTVISDATSRCRRGHLTIFPAMIVPGSGAGDNVNINTAHANVTAAPANAAILTFIGAASATLSPRASCFRSKRLSSTRCRSSCRRPTRRCAAGSRRCR
jgi:hypothetical protein